LTIPADRSEQLARGAETLDAAPMAQEEATVRCRSNLRTQGADASRISTCSPRNAASSGLCALAAREADGEYRGDPRPVALHFPELSSPKRLVYHLVIGVHEAPGEPIDAE
jgi:hypothetical protein